MSISAIAGVRRIGGISIVDLPGNIVLCERDSFLPRTLELLGGGRHDVLLNLENVGYVDASGIGALLAGAKRVRYHGGALKLLKPSSRVVELLRLFHLQDVFETFNDEPQALASFSIP